MKFFFISSFLLILPVYVRLQNAEREITIYNRCPFTTWVGIQGPGNPAEGGFRLDQGGRQNVYVSAVWIGTIWARTDCDEQMNCATGSCGPKVECNGASGEPPMTVAEFSMKSDGFNDTYMVSVQNGYNIPILIDPYGPLECLRAGGCFSNPNDFCPMEYAIQRNQVTVGCKTGCLVYNNDRECCRGLFANQQRCEKTTAAQIFKKSCPAAIAHEFDDANNTLTCNGASYVVQFC